MVYWFHIYSLLLSQNGDPAHCTTRIWDTFTLYRRRNVLSDSSRDLDGSDPASSVSSECGWSCRSGSSSCAPSSASSECGSGWSCRSGSASCAPSSASSEYGLSCRSGSSSCAPVPRRQNAVHEAVGASLNLAEALEFLARLETTQ